ncbi:hypothetical protein OOK48_35330 [Streptomyces viridodiastaticus]|uniref:hypothetical protein n=1 Tax=Streptomyces albogriseolus TaxID=1887 RepID=UPI00224CF37D|nr:hypothetical protein [Streptomyces viridodiastaticus]MCX4571595.1 hypothetical protein [Streptomyces viridodiastaticus]
MSVQHLMSWERDTTEYVNENNWVITQPTGVTVVSCSCGFTRTVANQDMQSTINDHQSEARNEMQS